MLNYLYKLIIDDVTDICYGNCLNFFPRGSRVLDVGIGNGIMLEAYHRLIESKNLDITGIDINRQYLKHCRKMIHRYGLEDSVRVHYAAVESYVPPENEYFDYVLFSMSFMLFDDQHYVLERIRPWLKRGGGVVFFQTMFKNHSLFLDIVKPRLKYVTTIDFGRVTYEDDFYALLGRKDMTVTEDWLLKREWFNGEYRLIVSAPENGNGRSAFNAPPAGNECASRSDQARPR
ncbi:MAG TPA: class I SAM-dependent methyltransferase [Deltaproteobacteria bacterium]|nr:class I SAM-dependent methyltransferase [Deltaproteobacteria bacterium]